MYTYPSFSHDFSPDFNISITTAATSQGRIPGGGGGTPGVRPT